MREHWELKKLGNIGDLFSGNSINTKVKEEKYLNLAEGIPYIATKDVGFDSVIDYENGIKIPITEIEKFRVARENTVLICAEGGSAGRKIGITNQDICLVNKLFAISANDQVIGKYVYYWYQTNEFQADFRSRLTGLIGGVSKGRFKEIEIPVPSLKEQNKIVEILDQAFISMNKVKENMENSIENTKRLFESYLQGLIENKGDDWEELTLKAVSQEFSRGKSKHRPRGDKSILGGKYPLIQTGDISNSDHWLKTYSRTYNKKGLAQSKLWKKGTICIAIVGANVAETAILTFDSCFPDSVIGIDVNPKKANNEYVEYLLQTFKSFLKEKGKGTARDNINLATFQNQDFPFPPVEQQQQIVKKLNSLSTETKKLEAIYQQKINDLDELKKSILRKAFAGELTDKEMTV